MCSEILSGNIVGVGEMSGISGEQLMWLHTVVDHGGEGGKVPGDIYVLQVKRSGSVVECAHSVNE